MESRRTFVQGAVLANGSAPLAAGAANAQAGTKSRYVDKLTDDAGKYVAAPLPFALDALEPTIDVAKLKAHWAAATTAVEASGWGILGDHPTTKKLMVLQCENHQKLTGGVAPLLVLDVFEHAHDLKYQNRRTACVGSHFNIINWDNVAERFDAARA